jgi:hypothetical protein
MGMGETFGHTSQILKVPSSIESIMSLMVAAVIAQVAELMNPPYCSCHTRSLFIVLRVYSTIPAPMIAAPWPWPALLSTRSASSQPRCSYLVPPLHALASVVSKSACAVHDSDPATDRNRVLSKLKHSIRPRCGVNVPVVVSVLLGVDVSVVVLDVVNVDVLDVVAVLVADVDPVVVKEDVPVIVALVVCVVVWDDVRVVVGVVVWDVVGVVRKHCVNVPSV